MSIYLCRELCIVIEMFAGVITESWRVLNDSAVYCLFGICMSGILKGFMSDDFVAGHLGTNNFVSVIKASLLGIPLPLCSCGVIPVATGLKRQGAGNGPTTAFLISTPETGVDSIAITYALLDPIMTVIRPLAAFITATVAGFIVNFMPDAGTAATERAGTACSCGCSCAEGAATPCRAQHSWRERVRAGLRFAFNDLLADIGPSLVLGIIIAGAIAYFVPARFIEQQLGSGLKPMLVMLLIGIPLYVCASASTPIVAALALKGLSPGAALVFLLAGPATNVATILIVAKIMGKRIAAVYVLVIAVVSLALGILINQLYAACSLSVTNWAAAGSQTENGMAAAGASLVLLACILRAKLKKK
jgi:uncharacterized membrane protein YraQ (UPF0718 family)